MESVETSRARIFLRHLAKSYKKHSDKKELKEQLQNQLSQIKKQYVAKKPSKKKINSDFKKLEKHIDKVINIEKSTHKVKPNKDDVKYRVEQLNNNLTKYINLIQERKHKIKKLENKIKQKASKNKEIYPKEHLDEINERIILRHKLYDLEDKYAELKLKGTPESTLQLIKQKIENLKEKI